MRSCSAETGSLDPETLHHRTLKKRCTGCYTANALYHHLTTRHESLRCSPLACCVVTTGCRGEFCFTQITWPGKRHSSPPGLSLAAGTDITPQASSSDGAKSYSHAENFLGGTSACLSAEAMCVEGLTATAPLSRTRAAGVRTAPNSHTFSSTGPHLSTVFPGLPACSKTAFRPIESDLSLSLRSVFREFCCRFWAAYNSRTSRQREEKPRYMLPREPSTPGLLHSKMGPYCLALDLESIDFDPSAP